MKLNWGISIVFVYFIFVTGMILLAVKASQQQNDMVTENYYEEAVNYQTKIDASNNAFNTKSKLKLNYLKNPNAIEVSIDKVVDSNVSGSLLFYKPDKASEDFKLNFKTDSSGKQILPLKILAHGYWRVNANWMLDGKNFYEAQKIFIP